MILPMILLHILHVCSSHVHIEVQCDQEGLQCLPNGHGARCWAKGTFLLWWSSTLWKDKKVVNVGIQLGSSENTITNQTDPKVNKACHFGNYASKNILGQSKKEINLCKVMEALGTLIFQWPRGTIICFFPGKSLIMQLLGEREHSGPLSGSSPMQYGY